MVILTIYILVNFVNNVNRTFTWLKNIRNFNHQDFRRRILMREIDICAHMYSFEKNFSNSSPVKALKWIIMVPAKGRLDPYLYFLLPFQRAVWYAILLTICYISALISVMEYVVSRRLKWMICFSEILLRFLYMPSEVPVRNSSIKISACKLQVIVFAFIVNNLYLAHLTTFLSTDLVVHNVETIEEMIKKISRFSSSSMRPTSYIKQLIKRISRNYGCSGNFSNNVST